MIKFPWDEAMYCFFNCDVSYLLIKQSNGARYRYVLLSPPYCLVICKMQLSFKTKLRSEGKILVHFGDVNDV
jgi:hypothetical protein